MANKRDDNRQKRARENRAQREALAARTKAASTPRPDRSPGAGAKGTPVAKGATAKGTSAKDAKGTGERAARPARLGQTPVDPAELEGSWLRKVVQVPGGLQVVMAAALVLVLTVMTGVVHSIPPEGADPNAPGTRTVWDVYGLGALLFLAPPVIIAGNALVFALHARRRRMWLWSAILMAGFSLVAPQYLFPAGFLGYATFRSRQIEDNVALGGRWRRPRPTSAEATDAGTGGDADTP